MAGFQHLQSPLLVSTLCKGRQFMQRKSILFRLPSVLFKTFREYFLNDEKYLSVPYCGLVPTKNNFSSSAISVGLCNWRRGDRVELQLEHHLLLFPDLRSPPKKYCFFNI